MGREKERKKKKKRGRFCMWQGLEGGA